MALSQKTVIRVGIDGRFLTGSLTGRGRYIFELCRDLDRVMPEAEFFVYAPAPINIPVVSPRWIARVDRLRFRPYRSSTAWLLLRGSGLCRRDGIHAFWAAGTLLPPLPAQVRKVVTVHDLNHLIVPETMKSTGLLAHRLLFGQSLRRANVIISNSKGTADRLSELLGFKSSAIIRPGVSAIFAEQPTELEVAGCLDAYGIRKPYLLSVATAEPRKNLELLISTVMNMKRDGLLPAHSLVLAGGGGWKDQQLMRLVEKGRQAGVVFPLGYVADEHLPILYRGADAFVFPSIYEGFGIPVLEARACGTPVVTSDTPELREAGGEDAIYVPPTEAGIRSGITQALTSRRVGAVDLSAMGWEGRALPLAAAFRGCLEGINTNHE